MRKVNDATQCHRCGTWFGNIGNGSACRRCGHWFGDCCMAHRADHGTYCVDCVAEQVDRIARAKHAVKVQWSAVCQPTLTTTSGQTNTPKKMSQPGLACAECGRRFSFVMKAVVCFGCSRSLCALCARHSIKGESLCQSCFARFAAGTTTTMSTSVKTTQPNDVLQCQRCDQPFTFVITPVCCYDDVEES